MLNTKDSIVFDEPEKTHSRMLIELDTLAAVSASVYELNDKQIATICDLIDAKHSDITDFRLDLFNYMNARDWDCIQLHFNESGDVIALFNFNSDIQL